MSVCPNGHDSAAEDYCDTCGILMGTASGGGGAASGGSVAGSGSGGATAAMTTATGAVAPEVSAGDCSNCGAARLGGERFCEICGLDFETGAMPQAPQPSVAAAAAPASGSGPIGSPAPPPPKIGWVAVLSCDAGWWLDNSGAGGVADGVPYPDPEPAVRRIELRSNDSVIGRTSGSSVADVDCGSADTGVSRKHAKISLHPDGTWTVTDLGSTNGTFIGDASTKLTPQAETAFDPSSTIKIGAYTMVRIEKSD